MNKLNLALKITNWCNMRCAHCSERSGPECTPQLMPVGDVNKYVSQFRDLQVPKYEHLVFTGGESMAPYYHGEYDYVPRCLDAAYLNGFVPFFKTNGMWGGDAQLRTTILDDLANAAYKYQKLVSLDISVDEFHNNIAQTAAIIENVFKSPRNIRAIRISLVGLNTPKSRLQFINLIAQVCARGLTYQTIDRQTLMIGYNGVGAHVYYGFDTPVSVVGRAADNKIGTAYINGQPDIQTGSCLQIDNTNTAVLNYKWREPVGNRNLNEVLGHLTRQMYMNGR